VIAIEIRAGETVTVVLPVMPESAALTVLVPALTAVTEPLDDTVATTVDEEDQVAEVVKFCVEPSL
jgi:hypothetical protein